MGVVQALHFMNEIRYRSYDHHEPVYRGPDLAHFKSMHLRLRLFLRFEQYDVFLAPERPIV